MSMIRRVLLVAALPLCFACIRSAGGSGPGVDLNLLTREQVREVQTTNAYDAIARLRPRWLDVRGGPRSFGLETEIVVFQDEMYLGGTETLRGMGIDGIYTIKFLDGATASATLPGINGRHVAHAIIVSMRVPNPGGSS